MKPSELSGSATEVSLDPLVLSLDGATVRGTLGVSNFKAPLTASEVLRIVDMNWSPIDDGPFV